MSERHVRMLSEVAAVYDSLYRQYGLTSRGVAWSTPDVQNASLLRLIDIIGPEAAKGGMSINDLGCGYGALFDLLRDHPALKEGRYAGYEICESLVEAALARLNDSRAVAIQSMVALWEADYSFASGTYNMRLDTSAKAWDAYVRESLRDLWSKSRRAMAFNMLSIHAPKKVDDLHYADPCAYLDFCIRELTPCAALRHDHSEKEWAILLYRVT